MKYYSEKLDKLFNSEAELIRAEKTKEKQEAEKKAQEEAKRAKKKERIDEVNKALDEYTKAKKKYSDLLNLYLKDYGTYTYKDYKDGIESIQDFSTFLSNFLL